MNENFDMVVIGTGPAGVQAAIQAARLNKRVVIVEKHPERLGGTWLHTGTIPSKTLREVMAAIRSIESHVGSHWVQRLVNTLSTNRLTERARTASMDEEKIVRDQLAQYKIEIIHGTAFMEDTHSVRVNPAKGASFVLTTEYIVIATGSRPRRPLDMPFDGWRVVDSDDILRLESLPKSITVFGAGVVGCEYACIFSALGVQTTIIDARTRIMQFIDQEVAEELKKSMEGMGVKFELGRLMQKMEVDGPHVRTTYNDLILETEIFFFAAGRESCSDHLGLERVGIEVNDRRAIPVNKFFQTTVPSIYAVGDVIGPPALASTSAEQGRLAAAHAFGITDITFPEFFPLGVYTIPEMSSVGLTEEELMKTKESYVVGRARYDQIARGYIRGDSYGLMKILVSQTTSKILGVHIVGADAANLIHIGQLCMIAGMTIQQFAHSTIFNFPTLAEGYKIASYDAMGELEKIQQQQREDSQDHLQVLKPSA
jgi:NAD(P) transhydrogenase